MIVYLCDRRKCLQFVCLLDQVVKSCWNIGFILFQTSQVDFIRTFFETKRQKIIVNAKDIFDG